MHKWIQYPLPCGRQSWNQRQLGKQSQWVPGKDEWLITNTDRSLITTYNDRHQVVVEGLLPQYIAATKVVSKPKIGQYAYMHKVYTCTLEDYRGGKHINHTSTLEDYLVVSILTIHVHVPTYLQYLWWVFCQTAGGMPQYRPSRQSCQPIH